MEEPLDRADAAISRLLRVVNAAERKKLVARSTKRRDSFLFPGAGRRLATLFRPTRKEDRNARLGMDRDRNRGRRRDRADRLERHARTALADAEGGLRPRVRPDGRGVAVEA